VNYIGLVMASAEEKRPTISPFTKETRVTGYCVSPPFEVLLVVTGNRRHGNAVNTPTIHSMLR
jgi:hypothetical protein